MRIPGQFLGVLLLLIQACSAARVLKLPSLTLPGIIGVWDRSNATWNSLYPASRFRDDSTIGYFGIWPENATGVQFKYYCEDPAMGNFSLRNFTYGATKGPLEPRPYYDLGLVELYQPYWKHWLHWQVDTTRLSYPINCEYNDLHELYSFRFWNMIMRSGCATAAVMQCIIQGTVAALLILRWSYIRLFRKDSKDAFQLDVTMFHSILAFRTSWFGNLNYGLFLSEVMHLSLLSLSGFSMMEAIGHSDLYTWRPMVMYNTGVVYSWLTMFAMLSAILRQTAHSWMGPMKDESALEAVNGKEGKSGSIVLEGNVQIPYATADDISEDWRWQRVFGQLGVLVLMGTYLSFVDDAAGGGLDQMAGLVLAAAVVACIWSFGVCAVVIFRSLRHIATQTMGSPTDSRSVHICTCVPNCIRVKVSSAIV